MAVAGQQVASLYAKFGADLSDYQAGISRVQSGMRQTASSVQTEAAGIISSFRGIGAATVGIGVGVAAITGLAAALGVAVRESLRFNAALEQSRVAWSVMLRSGQAADGMLRELQSFAARTPFEFPEIEQASRRLLAMGFAAKDVLPWLEDIGNAASAMGVGAEGMSRITWALGQMQASARVNAQDMMQLAQLGIPAWNILAQAMGKSTSEVRKLSEEGKIAADVFLQAFRQFSQQNWGDLMQRQSQTFNGALSTIRDNLRIAAGDAFKPLFEQISRLTVAFANFTQSGGLRDFAQNVALALRRVIDAVNEALPTINAWAATLNQVLGLYGQWAGAVLGVVEQFVALLLGIYEELFGALAPLFEQGLQTGADLWAGFADAVVGIVQTVAQYWTELIGNGIKAVNEIIGAGMAVAAGNWGQAWQHIKNLVFLAFKGIVNLVGSGVKTVIGLLGALFAAIPQQAKDAVGLAWDPGAAVASVERWGDAIVDTVGDVLGETTAQTVQKFDPSRWIENGLKRIESFKTRIAGIFKPATYGADYLRDIEQGLAKPKDAVAGINQAAAAMGDLGKAARQASVPIQDVVDALIAVHPAALRAAQVVAYWQSQIEATNLALRANRDQLRAAQAEYQRMSEVLAQYNEQLAAAQQRLADLRNARLTGQGQGENQIAWVQRQIQRLQYARRTGMSMEEVMEMFPTLSEAEAKFVAGLPQGQAALQRMLEQLQLGQSLNFDEALRQIGIAADGAIEEMDFADVIAGIQETHAEIGSLTAAIQAQEAAMAAQQAVIDSIEAASEALNVQLEMQQEQLALARTQWDAVNEGLAMAYRWFLEDRQKMLEMGGEAARQVPIIDAKMRDLLGGLDTFAQGTTMEVNTAMADMVASTRTAVDQSLAELARIPTDIYTTHHIITSYETAGQSSRVVATGAGATTLRASQQAQAPGVQSVTVSLPNVHSIDDPKNIERLAYRVLEVAGRRR